MKPFLSFLALVGLFFLASQAATAGQGDSTWLLNPPDHNWNNPANWTSGVPSGVAIFTASNVRNIDITQSTSITGILIQVTALFQFSALPAEQLVIRGSVTNNLTAQQNFIAESSGADAGGFIFDGDATVAETITGPVTFTEQAATTSGGAPGFLQFRFAGAGDTTIHNLGASVAGAAGGTAGFFLGGDTSAENSTIINDGATAAGASGGSCVFAFDTPTAANATLMANGGTNGGGGGSISFFDQSTGGTARVILSGNGYLDLSRHNGGLTIGSLEGDGVVFLGRNRLTVGANGLDTIFDGLLQSGDPSGNAGTGSLTKSGSGTLTLAGANLYTAGTAIDGGTLLVNSTTGSATGSGAVRVNTGTLGGKGIVAGTVTIGTGSGSGAFLAPAAGGTVPRRLTILKGLTFNSDATYACTLEATVDQARVDTVVAEGVTIDGSAVFTLTGTVETSLPAGRVFTVIRNHAANPIAGTFSNLPDGGIVTLNGTNFQASYEGGDGNDLTLTVVP